MFRNILLLAQRVHRISLVYHKLQTELISFYFFKEDEDEDKLSMNQSLKMTSSVLTTFPSKLYYVLEYMSDSANPSIAWGPNGDSFRVLLKKEFTQEIIPRYFKRKSTLIALLNFSN